MERWSRFYLTSLGNVLSWTPVAHTRTSLDLVALSNEAYRYIDDQPGKRVVQRGPTSIVGLTRWISRGIILCDFSKFRLTAEPANIVAFRSDPEPVMTLAERPSMASRALVEHSRYLMPDDDTEINRAVEEIKAVRRANHIRDQLLDREEKLTEHLNEMASRDENLEDEIRQNSLNTEIIDLRRRLSEYDEQWGPATQRERTLPLLGSCARFPTTAQGWAHRHLPQSKPCITCHWCGTRYSAGWTRCIMSGCRQYPIVIEGIANAYNNAISAGGLKALKLSQRSFPGDRNRAAQEAEHINQVNRWFLYEWAIPINSLLARCKLTRERLDEVRDRELAENREAERLRKEAQLAAQQARAETRSAQQQQQQQRTDKRRRLRQQKAAQKREAQEALSSSGAAASDASQSTPATIPRERHDRQEEPPDNL